MPVAAPVALCELDWTSPPLWVRPTGATDVYPGRTATYLWLFDEASLPFVDKVSSAELVDIGAFSPHFQRRMVGMFNGTDMFSILGAGAWTVNDEIGAASPFMNFDETESFAVVAVVRETTGTGGSAIIAEKIDNDVGGWQMRTNANVAEVPDIRHQLRDDDSGQKDYGTDDTTTKRVGQWFATQMVVDRAALKFRTQVAGGSSVDEDIIAQDLTNTETFKVFGSNSGTARGDCLMLAVFTLAQAEGLTYADLDTLMATYGAQNTTPVLDTYTQNSFVAPIVGIDPTYGEVYHKIGPGEFAHAYRAAFSHATGLGMLVEGAAVNLVKGSEVIANGPDWSSIQTPQVTIALSPSPEGAYIADTIAAAGVAEGRYQTMVVVAETDYVISGWERRGIDNTNCYATVEAYDKSNEGSIDTIVVALESDNLTAREQVAFTTPAGCESLELRVVVADGSKLSTISYQLETGTVASSYIPTKKGATGTRNATVAKLNNTSGTRYLNSTAGEVQVVCVLNEDVAPSVRYLFDASDGSTNNDRIAIWVAANGDVRARIWDAAGSLVQDITAADPGNWAAEHTVRLRWDSEKWVEPGTDGIPVSPVNADMVVDLVLTQGSKATWTAGTSATVIACGHDQASANHCNGVLGSIDTFNKWRAEAL